MFQFNTKDFGSHFYADVETAYREYLKHFATAGDYAYYKECCGKDLNEVTDSKIMEAIFRNVFEYVIYSGYN